MKLLEVVMWPLGELFFRTPIPFVLGGYAETRTTPPEFGVAGMLRSSIMDLRDAGLLDVEDELLSKVLDLGGGHTTYNFCWRLVGPHLYRDGEVFYPMPMDVFKKEEGESGKQDQSQGGGQEGGKVTFMLGDYLIEQLTPIPSGRGFELRRLLGPAVLDGEEARGWLASASFMKRYLEGEREFRCVEGRDVVRERDVVEKRIFPRVKLDRERKTVEIRDGEGMYYSLEKLILREGWGFIAGVWLDECSDAADVFLKLDGYTVRFGGRSGMVRLEVRWAKSLLERGLNWDVSGEARLLLTSSAILGDGGYTSFLPSLNVEGGVWRQVWIGGWDYAAGRPKAMYAGVAPGSVYYLRDVSGGDVLERKFVHPDYRRVLGSSLIAKGWGV